VTTIEDRLQAAARAAAETVAPGSAPPLRLPDRPSRGLAARWRGGRRWAGWLTPLAAAVAVAAVIAGSLVIAGGFRGHPAKPGPLGSERVPPYYVALTFTGNGNCCHVGAPFEPRTRAVVRSTATGAVLATITPPRPYGTFIGVTAAGDGRTFVLGAQREGQIRLTGNDYPPATRFFLLRINPAAAAGARARLTPLPIPAEPAGSQNQIWSFALSPRGTFLAVLGMPGIQVFNLATGAERTWRDYLHGKGAVVHGKRRWLYMSGYAALGAGATNAMLAWGGTHTLAFVLYGPPGSGGGVRLLDTRARGTDLLVDTRLLVAQPKKIIDPGSYWRQVLPTVTGSGVFVVLELGGHRLSQKLVEFSASTGQVLRVLNHIPLYENYEQVLWVSLSGRSLVVSSTAPAGRSPGAVYLSRPVILSGGGATPVPWPGQNFGAAW
jgi:hypothetical protein